MLGRSHYQVAAASWIAALAVGDAAGVHLKPAGLAMSLCAATASGIAPDIDHPESTATRNLGVIGAMVQWLVRHTLGKHRGATHTLAGVGCAAAVTGLAQLHPWAMAAVLFLLVGTAVDVVPKVPEGSEWIAAVGVAAVAPAVHDAMPPWLLPVAVAWGWHMHLICDRCTIQPLPYWYPLAPMSERTAWGLFRTGSKGETVTVWAVWAATAVVLWQCRQITA